MFKKWILQNKYPANFAEKFPGYSPVVLQLLYSRGLDTQAKIDEFLNPDYSQDVHDPFLFQDMKQAVERIQQAFVNKEKIYIYGDYDADGVTSSALMYSLLTHLGATDIEVYIPHRDTDGYGLSIEAAERIITSKAKLVITVDCGITNCESIALLKKNNIDTIVTDHHMQSGDLPSAHSIINCSLDRETKYPFKKLAGVGMAFKVAQALFKSTDNPTEYEAFEKWLLDLVTIGTIGDVSPILGENRTLVRYGLLVLNKTRRLGLQELIRSSSLSEGKELDETIAYGENLYDLDVWNIAFQIVPRLNAAGRIDHASLAYRLLITEDEMEALALARDIHGHNLQRQKIADEILNQAKESFGEITDDDKILITSNKSWNPGMVGLVAGKLKDLYNRPVIIIGSAGAEWVGSGRSISDFNITEALGECSQYLEKFGGHSKACGMTIKDDEKLEDFKIAIKKIASQKITDPETLKPTLEIDVESNLAGLSWELWDELERFEPFAEANPMPLFLLTKVKIEEMDIIGKNKTTLRFYITQNGIGHKAIAFGKAEEWQGQIQAGNVVDLVVEFGINQWNGNRELQFKILDFKK